MTRNAQRKVNALQTLQEYFESIPEGIDKMVSRRDLCIKWGVSDREIRRIIHDISEKYDPENGQFIYSTSLQGVGGGYCRTDDTILRRLFLSEVRNRGINVFGRGKQARTAELRAGESMENKNNLAEYRKRAGLSQKDVCAIVEFDGLTVQHLSRLEKGHAFPTAAQMKGLCILYGCSARELFGKEYIVAMKNALESSE